MSIYVILAGMVVISFMAFMLGAELVNRMADRTDAKARERFMCQPRGMKPR